MRRRKAAQLNLDHSFRNPKKDVSKKKPGKAWAYLEYNSVVRDQWRRPLLKAEWDIISKYLDKRDVGAIQRWRPLFAPKAHRLFRIQR
jgi:hypothetical protein